MKKHLLLYLLIIVSQVSKGQGSSACALKIGDNYYINCKSLIMLSGQSILSIPKDDTLGTHPNFDVFNKGGMLIAKVREGILLDGDEKLYIIKSDASEYSFVEKASKRIICYMKKGANTEKNWCEISVWADMYMPDGSYFQCTPETTNIPFLNMMHGSIFRNSRSAIELN